MPRPPSEVKAKKKSAFSCEQCRQRKLKCAGQRPRCSRCQARNEPCTYVLAPTLSYTTRLEKRIEELEKLLQQSTPGSQVGSSGLQPQQSPSSGSAIPAAGHHIIQQSVTSFFEAHQSVAATHASPESPSTSTDDRKARLVQNAWQQRSLEGLAQTPEPFQYILSNHWCWIQPLFNFVYRPAFTRDMQVMGPYYSHVLMNAMLAHSVRWCSHESTVMRLLAPYENGRIFSRHARTLLFEELQHGPGKVTTVQTALLLSAQECAVGNRTQAWTYSGIAFRLITDIGITVDNERYAASADLTEEDIEIRVRLFWSCYFWDKLISLYLGRSPTIQHTSLSPPHILLDDSAEHEIWSPHGITLPPGVIYPPMKSHATSCFVETCKLSIILDQIMHYMYDSQYNTTHEEREACVQKQEDELNQWWDALPSFLKIDASAPPLLAPPSHIVTMNCLFHTFKILLYRPMLFAPPLSESTSFLPTHCLKQCVIAATSITILFDLFRQTFGEARIVLSVAYSLYTAASILLVQLEASPSNDQAWQRLRFCLQALDRAKISAPVLNAPLDALASQVTRLNEHAETSHTAFDNGEAAREASTAGDDSLHELDFSSVNEAQWRDLVDLGFPEIDIDPNFFDILPDGEAQTASVGAFGAFQ